MTKKQFKNQSQSGRSMVEMLGVLAIIGVLSIGGIAGYKMAMNRYQANQIANEINLMRTDAKIKVARGVELLLGEPYDGESGHLKFNESYGVAVAFPVTISDEEGGEEGYSFTLSGIPAGVCKPLATLLDGMDDTAALEINGKDYETTENPCDNEENEVVVAFSTKDIGGVSSGSGDPEEPPQDDDPVPEECPRGTTLSEDESECTCEDTEKTCNGGCCAGCSGGKVWTGRRCACPEGAEPSEDGEECACKEATPYWDGTKCTTCPEGSQPQDGKCVCSSDTSKEWKASLENGGCDKERVGECEKNSDCGLGEYCYLKYGKSSCTQEFQSNKFGLGNSDSYKGQCKKARGDISKSGDSSKYVVSDEEITMTWWSAKRFCEALGKHMVSATELKCKDRFGEDFGYGKSNTWCYCHNDESTKTCTESSISEVSSEVKELRKANDENGNSIPNVYFWLKDAYDTDPNNENSCSAYSVNISHGYVCYRSRYEGAYALCE